MESHSFVDPRELRFTDGQVNAALKALGYREDEVDDDSMDHFSYLLEAMRIFTIRRRKYGNAWQEYGAIDCLFHMRSKLARITAVIRQKPGALDDGIDLLNYTVFAMRNALAGRVGQDALDMETP